MPKPKIHRRLLLIENDQVVVENIRGELRSVEEGCFELKCVSQFSQSLELLSHSTFDVIILSISLPEFPGLGAFYELTKLVPDVPILVLAPASCELVAKQAVQNGAHDYLLVDHLDAYSLGRSLSNVFDRKAIEDALYVEKERAVVTLNSIGDAVLCTDMAGNISYLNLVAETMTGWRREDAIGQPLSKVFNIVDGTTRLAARDPMEMAVAQNRTVGLTVNCVLIRRDGYESAIEDSAAPIHDRGGKVIGAVIVFHDVTAARAMSIEMTHSAQYDLVTNLPSRLLLNDRISQSISLARRQNRHLAILFLDLDRFKYINDSLGHAVGDQLLQSVAKRLMSGVRGSDTVSRQGGDEFVILLSEITLPEDAARGATKILNLLSAPHSIEGQELHIDGSIGISIFPTDGDQAETLIKNADMAMYHAKECGRNNFQFFKPEMNLRAIERQSLEGSLRRALEREEFLLHYQPKINMLTGEITGAEALLRWQQPGRDLVSPARFVPIAEDCGLIVPIGRWVLREACTQARIWQKAGLPTLSTAVNVSAVEFRDPEFVRSVSSTLSETGLEAQYLELELTERVLMENVESTACVLKQLKAMGISLAVDDFGTGYSSLSYLRQFPIDTLKIDQSFVCQITPNSDDSAIVSAIINMAKSLKHAVVAEGVETLHQQAYLQSLGCVEAQGYLFSKPVVAIEFAALLKNGLVGPVVAPGLIC
jgi:diguanylate cyclase (GGDEF)-like protein/PAS domain S-box-containing protein